MTGKQPEVPSRPGASVVPTPSAPVTPRLDSPTAASPSAPSPTVNPTEGALPPGPVSATAVARTALSPTARARRQLTTASLIAAAAIVVAVAAVDLMSSGPPLWSVVVAVALVIAVGQLAVLSAAVRQRSSDVLNAAVAVAAVVLAAAVGVLSWLLFAGRIPLSVEQPVVQAALIGVGVAAGVSAVLVPIALRWSRAAHRRGRRSPDELLALLSSQVAAGAEPDEFLREFADSVRRSLLLSGIEIWTGDGSRLDRTVVLSRSPANRRPAEFAEAETNPADRSALISAPAPETLTSDAVRILRRTGVSGPAWISMWLPQLLRGRSDRQVRLASAVHADTMLALLIVEREADDEPFSTADERALAEVAARLAIVLRNRALDSALQQTLDELQIANSDLRASRARLVASSDAQRRRIERDLHDGAQQHLVALAVSLNLLRSTMSDMTPDQVELVDELEGGVRSTITELRNLAHGIYPPLLRDAGLGSALTAAARRASSPVTVRVALGRRYPQDIEAAIYFCCLEGLQNAAKHAPGAAVTIEVREVDPGPSGAAPVLDFVLADDGPGFDPAAGRRGAGMINMTDRIGAIGGTIRWQSAVGAGTTVTGQVPVAEADTLAAPVQSPSVESP